MKRGVLIRRYKRFLADVLLDEGGETTVHCPNPGAMLGLNAPGLVAWCSKSGSASRKLPQTLELVETDGGLVGINTMYPNRIVAEALKADAIPELSGYASVRPEVRYGEASRVDFFLEGPDRPPLWLEIKNATTQKPRAERLWLEVKNCHLRRAGTLAEFPDCVAARSTKHVRELAAMVKKGDRAAILFVVQRMDCDRFSTAADLDPEFANTLERAADAGLEVLVYTCHVELDRIEIAHRIPWVRHSLNR
jgi:sugar fermentation stimulation protein A